MHAAIMRGSIEHIQIDFRAEFTIKEGKIEEYKKLIQDVLVSLATCYKHPRNK
jgi:hypothetical protein